MKSSTYDKGIRQNVNGYLGVLLTNYDTSDMLIVENGEGILSRLSRVNEASRVVLLPEACASSLALCRVRHDYNISPTETAKGKEAISNE